jgi:two-component system sensor histidine kinase VicK
MSQYKGPPAEILKALETAPNMYLVLSPDLYIITASDAYLQATETTRDMITGKHIFEAFPDNPDLPDGDDGMQNINTSLQNVLRTKKPDYMRVQRYDVPDVKNPGKFIQRYWDPSHTPVLDENGDIAYIIQLATNVTEKILTERALLKSQLEQDATLERLHLLTDELLLANTELRQTQQNLNLLNSQLEERIAKRTRELADSEEKFKAGFTEQQTINEILAASNEEQAASNEELLASNEQLALVNERLLTAQQKIEEGEVALRLAINAANFGTWFIHSVTREFITDARLKELFGYYADESLSIEQALAQITEEYRGFVATKLENAIYNSGDYDVTYPVIGLHDNRLRWLRAIGNLKADPSGAFSAFTGVVMDITEQYLAANEIKRAEETLRMAIDAAGLGAYYINAEDRIFVTSPKLKEFFGFGPEEEVPYDAAINQIHPDYRQQVNKQVDAAFASGERFDLEYPIIGHNDGKTRWVRGIGEIQHNDGKDVFTGVLHEITEKKLDELRKNDFIGMVSHELKTPLTSLTAIVQILQAKLKHSDDPFVPGALKKANIQVKKMSNMINGFLNISRLESGKIVIDKQPFAVGDLIKEVIDETNLIGATHTIDLDHCDEVTLIADKDKIGSVLSNLLSNAVKYSPKGSTIKVNCAQLHNEVKISVTDEGLGVLPEDKDHIFDRYYRIENKNTKHISGFGIGLYLSAEIVRRHGGKIWVESEGEGSTFSFSLPVD